MAALAIEAEVVVVGAGSAGCVVAGRLAEAGWDVLVLERGPDYGRLGSLGWPNDLLDARALATSHDAGYDSEALYGARVVRYERAHVIGGCSSHNGCIAAVGHASDYDAWRIQGWADDDLRPFFGRALARMRVTTYRETDAGPFHQAALDAAVEAGFHGPLLLDDLDAGAGFGLEATNIEAGIRFNAAFAYIDPVRDRANLRILDGTRVDRLTPLPGGEVMVQASRGPATLVVRAPRVVVAAGTYDTPALLLRSGIGDPSQLAALNIPTVHPLPGVGQNLHDHPMIELAFARSAKLQRELSHVSAKQFVPEEQTLGKFASSRCDGPYDLHVLPVGAATQVRLLDGGCAIAIAPLCPRSRGSVSLRDTDPTSQPVINHRYLDDPEGHDIAVMRDGIELARDLASQRALQAMLGKPEMALETDDDIRAHVCHYFHPVGTCKLGTADDPEAVCDPHGGLHGLAQITIADCSLIPRTPRANTNVPAVMIGERIADILNGTKADPVAPTLRREMTGM
jgi:choline dehydrogenase